MRTSVEPRDHISPHRCRGFLPREPAERCKKQIKDLLTHLLMLLLKLSPLPATLLLPLNPPGNHITTIDDAPQPPRPLLPKVVTGLHHTLSCISRPNKDKRSRSSTQPGFQVLDYSLDDVATLEVEATTAIRGSLVARKAVTGAGGDKNLFNPLLKKKVKVAKMTLK